MHIYQVISFYTSTVMYLTTIESALISHVVYHVQKHYIYEPHLRNLGSLTIGLSSVFLDGEAVPWKLQRCLNFASSWEPWNSEVAD